MSGRQAGGFPPQIKYIVGNEAAERYSFYGMRSILTLFMTQTLLFSESKSISVFHLFVLGVYFTPLLGGYLSDRFWGKYRTIMTLSTLYVAGHAVLAFWESEHGLYVGLGLISLGAGGIKPCVSAHVGDQFTQSSSHLVKKVFALFYFSINFGSFFAYLVTPWTRAHFGPSVAFGIPGVLMAIAVFVFWLGRDKYISVPPTGRRDDSPRRVWWHALRHGRAAAVERFGTEAVDAGFAVIRVGLILLPVCVFWALYDQTGSSWVLQATRMELHGMQPEQLGAMNPLLVMVLIPLFAVVVFPALERRGITVSPLRKITLGLFLTAASFVAVAVLEFLSDSTTVRELFVLRLDQLVVAGAPLDRCADMYVEFFANPVERISFLWQIVPYVIITAGEVLVSITGLEFAYTQAPRSVKSTIMSLWLLTTAIGNFLTALTTAINVFEGVAYFAFWAGLMGVVAVVFALMARAYRSVDYIEPDEADY